MAALMDWPDDLGYGTLTGRIGYMDGDHNDSDRKPDMNAVTGGSVMIEPSVKAVRYTGVGGPIILTARKTMGVIDDQGYICTPAAPGETPSRGIVVPATDDEQLNPTNFTYKVTITAPNFSLSPFNIAVPTGSTQDLTLIAPVPASGGTATVVDVSTAIRAEDAAARAESIADGLDQAIADAVATGDWTGPQGRGIVSITDNDHDSVATVTYTDGVTSELPLPEGRAGRGIDSVVDNLDGTATVRFSDNTSSELTLPRGQTGRGISSITDDDQNGSATVTFTDGETSELILPEGPKGDKPVLTWSGTSLSIDGVVGPNLKGTTGDPGPSGGMGSTFLHGPGRPDQPVTTAGIITGSEVVGTTYTSTDGAGVGAWVWRKRPTGWAVVDGDTGWRDITTLLAHPNMKGGLIRVKRVDAQVFIRLSSLELTGSGNFTADNAWPVGFRIAMLSGNRVIVFGLSGQGMGEAPSWGNVQVPGYTNNQTLHAKSATAPSRGSGNFDYITDDTWPTTLPGTPA